MHLLLLHTKIIQDTLTLSRTVGSNGRGIQIVGWIKLEWQRYVQCSLPPVLSAANVGRLNNQEMKKVIGISIDEYRTV